jgi:hypothetical protein
LLVGRHRGQDPLAEIAGPLQVGAGSPAAPGEGRGEWLGHAGRHQPGRHLLGEPLAEDGAGDGQPDRAPDLLEERDAACRCADLLRRHGVLDDQGEHRERRPDAETRQDHPEPEDRPIRVGAQVRHEEEAERQQDQRADHHQLVAMGPRHDLAGGDRREDHPDDEG